MKKLLLTAFALIVALGVGMTAFAQGGYGDAKTDKSSPAAPLKKIKGTVKPDGDKITFVTDQDGKSWDVMNPEVLKGHEGHHVELSAHVYTDKNSLHVMSVKMIKAPSSKSSY
jgi:hypothetical protein